MSVPPFALRARTLSIIGEEIVLMISVESPREINESRRTATIAVSL